MYVLHLFPYEMEIYDLISQDLLALVKRGLIHIHGGPQVHARKCYHDSGLHHLFLACSLLMELFFLVICEKKISTLARHYLFGKVTNYCCLVF